MSTDIRFSQGRGNYITRSPVLIRFADCRIPRNHQYWLIQIRRLIAGIEELFDLDQYSATPNPPFHCTSIQVIAY